MKMYQSSTWNMTISDHLQEFNENNHGIKKIVGVNIEEIKNNEKMNNFIKDIFIIFNKFYKCGNNIMVKYNTVGSEQSKEELNFIDDNKILLNYKTVLETTKINIPDTEIDKNLIKIFEQ